VNIDQAWKKHYPFQDHYLTLDGNKYHYIDEGEGHPVIMLHGNPTWSFFYRNVVNKLKTNFRCIVPDHIGCGMSDKPQDYNYTLENHINNVLELIKELKIDKFSLVVHDWGGAIGMGVATRLPEKVCAMTIMNTAAFKSLDIPFSISLCKIPYFGEKMVRYFNGFAWPATFMAVEKKLPTDIKDGYLAPYDNYKNRIATARFVKDIPLHKWHPSYPELERIENDLHKVTCPKLFIWGEKDFCFNMNFLKRWRDFYPNDKVITYKDAGHYVIEDEKENAINEIGSFFNAQHCM
jgi:pimeloyl-ACP methyl ester carboxylesterase